MSGCAGFDGSRTRRTPGEMSALHGGRCYAACTTSQCGRRTFEPYRPRSDTMDDSVALCPYCGDAFDTRDLATVLTHVRTEYANREGGKPLDRPV